MTRSPVIGKVNAVGAAADSVSVYAELWLAIFNSGKNTVWVNLEGGTAVVDDFQSHELPPGETLPCPPLGRNKISAICVRAGGRLTIFGSEQPMTSLPKKGQQTATIIRGFYLVAPNDNDLVVYDIAADFIAVAGGHRVLAVTFFVYAHPAFIRYEVATAGAEPADYRLLADETYTDNNLELINSIHARNVGAGNNFEIHGICVGD